MIFDDDIVDKWDMVTGIDSYNVSVTYLQLREHPFTIVELWWESGGSFKFTYEATGTDVMGVWPHGKTSNISAWDEESLVDDIKQARGTAAIPARQLQLGTWRVVAQDRFINITNSEQPDNELLLTDFGFVFFDRNGRALINRGAPHLYPEHSPLLPSVRQAPISAVHEVRGLVRRLATPPLTHNAQHYGEQTSCPHTRQPASQTSAI